MDNLDWLEDLDVLDTADEDTGIIVSMMMLIGALEFMEA